MNLHDDLCAVLLEHGFEEPTDSLSEFLIKCLEAHLAVPLPQEEPQSGPNIINHVSPENPLANYCSDHFPGFFESKAHKQILSSLNQELAAPGSVQSLYLVPPRFGATTLFAEALASYCMDEDLNTLVISSHQNTSERVEKLVANRRRAPTPRGSKFTAPGYNIRRDSYDVIIIDAYTALDMPQGEEWFTKLLQNAELHTKIFVVGFINGKRSLTYKLSKNEEWTTHHYPAINKEGESIDPARWPVSYFQKQRLAVGPQLFHMNYQQNPPYGD